MCLGNGYVSVALASLLSFIIKFQYKARAD